MLCFKTLTGMVVLFLIVIFSVVIFCVATLIACIIDYETNYHDDDDPIGFLTSDPFYDIGDFYYWRWGLVAVAGVWAVLFLITLVGRCIDWGIYAGVHCGHYTSRAFCCWLFCGESFCRDCDGKDRFRAISQTDLYLEDAREMRQHNIKRWSSHDLSTSEPNAATPPVYATSPRALGQMA